jgi:tetratricopeptide (TPR) repeat protein
MDEYVQNKKEDIHDHILSSYESSRKELIAYEIRKNKEPEEKRLLRLSKEYENLDDLDMAMKYYKNRITLMQNKEIWNKFSILSKKMGNLIQTEQGIMRCLKIVEENEKKNLAEKKSIFQQKTEIINFSILLSSIKYLKGRMKDAIDIMTHLINKYSLEKTNYTLNAFLAFLYHEFNKNILFIKHYEAAKRFKMIELNIDLHKPKYNPKIKSTYKNPTLTTEQCDEIWYHLIRFFTKNEFNEISEKLLQFISEESKKTSQFKLAKAKICLYFNRNDEVIQLCDEILSEDEQYYDAWVLRGHAYYFKNNLFDSEESYIKAIKYKVKSTKFDIQMLTRLGIVYIRRKTWSDAKVVFLQILRDSVYHSFAWRYLGLALTNLEEYEAAEEALNEAILLDIENPLTWAYLTMFCIKVKRKEQALACLNELIKMKFNIIDITSEIASLFYKENEIMIAANLYKRIINLDKTYIDAQVKLAEIYFMKFDDSKKKEAIDILKNSLQYATDDKEKRNILQFIQIYENQIDYGKTGNQVSEKFENNNSNMNAESGVNEDSEFKDNFD